MPTDSLHVVLGDDDYLVRQRAKEIYDGHSKDFPDDLSREIIAGRADRVEDVERSSPKPVRPAKLFRYSGEASSYGSTRRIFSIKLKREPLKDPMRPSRHPSPFLKT